MEEVHPLFHTFAQENSPLGNQPFVTSQYSCCLAQAADDQVTTLQAPGFSRLSIVSCDNSAQQSLLWTKHRQLVWSSGPESVPESPRVWGCCSHDRKKRGKDQNIAILKSRLRQEIFSRISQRNRTIKNNKMCIQKISVYFFLQHLLSARYLNTCCFASYCEPLKTTLLSNI